MSRVLTAFWIVILILGCGGPASNEEPSVKTVADNRPKFELSPVQPFCIELGRGSGWDGLDTLKIDETGNVSVNRRSPNGWQTASFSLLDTELSSILKSLSNHNILGLNRDYSLEGVADGKQWIFWARQNDGEKTIYFNNHFPVAIIKFAQELDSFLRVESRPLNWKAIPAEQERDHEEDLWDSIQ